MMQFFDWKCAYSGEKLNDKNITIKPLKHYSTKKHPCQEKFLYFFISSIALQSHSNMV